MSSADAVTVPLRYGRLSRTRGNTSTMVLSRACALGHAKLVPCVRGIANADALIAEAECLWGAEQADAKNRVAATWGRVAVLCNPEREKPVDILDGWAQHVAKEPYYCKPVSKYIEMDLLDRTTGILRIDWPRQARGGAPAGVDILLAAVTDPKFKGSSSTYPSPKDIADAWNGPGNRAEYFWNNTDNGICTFEDADIRASLRPREEVGV